MSSIAMSPKSVMEGDLIPSQRSCIADLPVITAAWYQVSKQWRSKAKVMFKVNVWYIVFATDQSNELIQYS